MKNNFFSVVIIIFFNYLFFLNANSSDQFNFDITEGEILEKGNIFKGLKRGTITTNDGIILNADNFEYNKTLNVLKANGNIKIEDTVNKYQIYSNSIIFFRTNNIISTKGNSKAIDLKDNTTIDADKFEYNKSLNILKAIKNVVIEDKLNQYLIYSDKAKYLKNEDIVSTKGNSKAIDLKDDLTITADEFEYNKVLNIVNASNNVVIKDKLKDYIIYSNKINYLRNQEKIFTVGATKALIQSKYNFKSKDVTLLRDKMKLSSNNKTRIIEKNNQIYNLSKFNYSINKEILKGEKLLITTNYNLPKKSDKFYFESGIFDLKNKSFIAKDTKIKIHKNVFDDFNNDPRIEGVSSNGQKKITTIKKAVFTSCKMNDKCPPWSIKADEIIHDKNKKQLTYINAFLNLYDLPVFYFPKFFHPDPSVNRQTGLLKPEINHSNILGSSITLPYFNAISDNKDYTFVPTWSDNKFIFARNEYRQAEKDYNFITDFGFVKDYKPTSSNKKKDMSHLFAKYDLDLKLEDFISSKLFMSYGIVSYDQYLGVFDTYMTKSKVKPGDDDNINNQIELTLNHENYNFTTGFHQYENLSNKKDSDRYQYVLPYYSFDKMLFQDFFNGSVSFGSSGSNNLKNTNDLVSSVVNDITYQSNDYISGIGFKNDIKIDIKNLNSVGKKNSNYKSSPQIEMISLFNYNVSFPLIKNKNQMTSLLTPKLSFRVNPSDMRDYSSSGNSVNASSLFNTNRLGFSDTYEGGRSLTLGIDYRREKNTIITSEIDKINKEKIYENNKTTINNKDIFELDNDIEEKFELNYRPPEKKDEIKNINKYFELKLAAVLRDKEEKFIPRKSTLNRKQSNLFGSVTNRFSEMVELNYNFSIDNDFNRLEYNDLNATFSFNNLETSFHFIEENGELGDTNSLQSQIKYNFDESNFLTFKTRRNRKTSLTEYYDLVYEYKNDCLTAGIKYKRSYYEDRDLLPTESLLFTLTFIPLTSYEHNFNDLKESIEN